MGKSYSVDRYDSEGVGETLKDFATYQEACAFARKNLAKYGHLVVNHWDDMGGVDDSRDFYKEVA